MNVTKKYSTRGGAEMWRDNCSRQHPDKKIEMFRDMTKVSTYIVGIIQKTDPLEYVLECGTVLQRHKFSKIK